MSSASISPRAYKALEDAAQRRVAQRILDFVELEDPRALAATPEGERLRVAIEGMNRALALGVPRGHGAVALYAALRFLGAPEFDRHPACRTILEDQDLPPEARVFALLDPALGVPWQEIAASGAGER